MTTLDYAYRTPSSCTAAGPDGAGARLDLATSGGTMVKGQALDAVAHPFFFSGFVAHPGVVAQALLVVARVARTRFYVPPNMLAAILRAADPVVTCTSEGLRFESFSACCGVYARLDVDANALDIYHAASGVTNVDVNPPLRQALAGLHAHEQLHLNVGEAQLRVATPGGEVVEEKVALPERWLKGFAETQMLGAAMAARHTLDGLAARQFIQGLPRNSATKTVMWATQAARTLRLASQPSANAVCVAGPERLRVLEPLLHHATGLHAYAGETDNTSLPMASTWVLALPGGRLTIALSPEKSRGFSGEGAVLHALSGAGVADDADSIASLLRFEARIDVERLAREALLAPERVGAALALLASSGQVGFDVSAGAYFHRPLPVRADALESLHPRLADARRLVAVGAVRPDGAGGFQVHTGGIAYEVHLASEPADDRCTCPWFAKHRGTRGPCKHVLAVRITVTEGKP